MLPEAIARSDERIVAGLAGAPQTNEIARSAMLLPGFLTVARETGLPLDLFEIGASAGLNLLFDSFHYRYGDAEWGDPPPRPVGAGGAWPCCSADWRHKRSPSLRLRHRAGRLRRRGRAATASVLHLGRSGSAAGPARRRAVTSEKLPPLLVRADAAGVCREGAGRTAAGRRLRTLSFDHVAIFAAGDKGCHHRHPRAGGQTSHGRCAYRKAEDGAARSHKEVGSAQPDPMAGRETRRLAHCDYHGRWIEWIG